MKKVDDIVAAAERLDAQDFVRLRQKLDQLEKNRWQTELSPRPKSSERPGLPMQESTSSS